MSRPRYTCIESTETISHDPTRRATSSATPDLPDAVAPTIATAATSASRHRDARAVRWQRRHRDQLALQVVRRRGRHPHVGERADAKRVLADEVHELVLPRATG